MPISKLSFQKKKKTWAFILLGITRRRKIGFNSLNHMRDQIFLLSTLTPGICNSVSVKIDDEEDNIIQYTFLYFRFRVPLKTEMSQLQYKKKLD